jgi:hypothetical protein
LPAENAVRELKMAFNAVMELGTALLWARPSSALAPLAPLTPEGAFRLYRTASALYRNQHLPSSELWARACQHYATALWHEAKLDWLEGPNCPRDLLELPNAEVEFHLHESPEEIRDLLDDLIGRPPITSLAPGTPGIYAFEWIPLILERAKIHLENTSHGVIKNLKYCEAVKASGEWARCAEELMSAFLTQRASVTTPMSA